MNEQTSQVSTVESGQDQQILGFVASTEGATVVVVSPDGTLRELKMGDPIHEGDVIQVTDGSHVAISFADGSVRQLNSGDSFVVGLDSHQQLAAIESAEEENPEFQDLLATLAAGEDIAEDQEATAAGAEDGASGTGDEIGQGLQFSLLGGEVTPTAGIDPDYVPPPLPDPTANADISENGINNGEANNNDAVVTNDARSVTEDQDLNPVDSVPDTVLSVTGAISVSDVDQGEGAFDPATLSFGGRTNSSALDTDTTELGTLTLLDDQGNYSFAVDNAAVQYLAAGDTVVQTWTVDSVDGSGTSTITITINGLNDGAVVTNDARSVTEDQDLNPVDSVPDTVLSVTGAISVSDVDQGEGAFDPATLSFGGRTNSSALDTDTTELGTLTLLDDQGNYSFAVDNAAVQYLAAGDTVVQTWTVDSVDGSGTSTITITINGTNDGPVANPDTNFVNESIDGADAPIIFGNVISGGDNGIDSADSFAGAEQYADVADTDVDLGDALRIVSINNQSVSLGTTAANGTQLAGLYGVLTIGADGSYAYDLDDNNPLLADLNTGEELNEVFNYTVSDSSGAESSSTLTITVNGQDQGQPPLELGVTKNLYVGLDELVIKNLQVGFVDATFINGTANTSQYNTDSDPYIDQLGWGRPVSSTGQSGYTLVDNTLFSSETGSTVDVGSTFKLADFQHLNFPIAVNSSNLQEVYLVLDMDIVINGVHLEKPIDLKLLMSHDETPNDSGDPRDIISLPPQMITVNLDGFDYDFHVLGFRDVDGNLVDAIYTNENAVNDFEIVGSFTSSSENPQVLDSVSGTVGTGSDDVVTWTDTSSEYGTLTVSEDGSYEYILNSDIKNVLDVGENLVDIFEYTVTNQFGSTTSTLEINISGYQNIYGSSGDDSLMGTSANEYLTGAAGDDVLNGAGADDVLIGGPGNDSLTGGPGADVFKWVAGDEGIGAIDIVTDYNQSSGSYDPSEGDILDLSDLLVGVASLDTSGMTLAEALDASFLTVTSDGTDTSIVADVDGGAAGTTTQTIVLQGVDLTNGGEFSSAEVIESLISNNNLVVD
ncbi:retention module-containing protein [uncultured Porticoccus sp.]|uniref:retention module-containing protein n=1 Tax=uncultured Porticoccus sp. TaxID=1256050 RepID=UPI00262DA4A6|nr:retention module-containing protein [uncultured Porticoccus sp.]